MFLDSGNIISDETFGTQSQMMVEKVPDFSAESLCLCQLLLLLFLLMQSHTGSVKRISLFFKITFLGGGKGSK